MHISEGILSGPVLASGVVLAAAGTTIGLKKTGSRADCACRHSFSLLFCGIPGACSHRTVQHSSDFKRYCRALAGVGGISDFSGGPCPPGDFFSVWRNHHTGHQYGLNGLAGRDLPLHIRQVHSQKPNLCIDCRFFIGCHFGAFERHHHRTGLDVYRRQFS